MGSSYSKDFRKKVMSYVTKGNSCNKAAVRFEIASNTVRNCGIRDTNQRVII